MTYVMLHFLRLFVLFFFLFFLINTCTFLGDEMKINEMNENIFGLKEDYPSQINSQNQLSHPNLSQIEQKSQESLIQGKIHIKQN